MKKVILAVFAVVALVACAPQSGKPAPSSKDSISPIVKDSTKKK